MCCAVCYYEMKRHCFYHICVARCFDSFNQVIKITAASFQGSSFDLCNIRKLRVHVLIGRILNKNTFWTLTRECEIKENVFGGKKLFTGLNCNMENLHRSDRCGLFRTSNCNVILPKNFETILLSSALKTQTVSLFSSAFSLVHSLPHPFLVYIREKHQQTKIMLRRSIIT